MSIPKAERWMQVEWNSGGQSVVNAKYLLKSLPNGEELKIGTVVTIGKQENGSPLTATVLASAREREHFEKEQQPIEETADPNAGTSAQNDQEQEDYSPSASDWEPEGECSSEESEEEVDDKKIKLERSARQYSNKKKKVITPTHRTKAVIPNGMQQLALQNIMKNRQSNDRKLGKALPDSTKKYKTFDVETANELINSMKSMFQELFKILGKIKPSFNVKDITDCREIPVEFEFDATDNTREMKNESNDTNNTQEEEKLEIEYSDRSDDNVLITNRYDTVDKKIEKSQRAGKNEWVPIGSGTTLIHRDKYRKVNWKSYTVATRTLLLAAFSRRTLATHSLTGKKSPAFTNKPAKMCLDPKIVSDIVIEITDKFKVKDNLVRSIITTKCADECKMYKMQKNKLNSSEKKKCKNQENVPPNAANNTAN